jgi:predicted kinase
MQQPTAIILAGSPGTGKSTLARALAKQLPTAFLLEKDIINEELCRVRETNPSELIAFNDYLKPYEKDMEKITTPFGSLTGIPLRSEYFGRHVRDQTYTTMIRLSKTNLALGKSPIFESLLSRQFEEGIVGKVLEEFEPYRVALIYTYVDDETIRKRMVERMKQDSLQAKWNGQSLASEEAWRAERKKFPILPASLEKFEHLKVNTNRPLEEYVPEVIRYLA